jgi:hypothetical protein
VIGKQLTGHVDNASYPAIAVDIQMALVTPPGSAAPVMMMFGGGVLTESGNPTTEQLVAAGWGYVSLSPTSVQADNGAGLTRGVIGLVNKGQPRRPDDWGALRAWAWGASRGLDYLESDGTVDAKRVGIEGVSRYGKAALVAMAFDRRFAVALVGSSGEGGAKLHRRAWGEQVENLTGAGEYHWMRQLSSGARKPADERWNIGGRSRLIALCAPRPTFISWRAEKAIQWLDLQGSFMAVSPPVRCWAAGAEISARRTMQKEKMPAVGVGLLDGPLAWRQRRWPRRRTGNTIPWVIG